jgi:pilus assembly protein CpaE
MAPTLASVRALLRLLPAGGDVKGKRPIVVLNRLGLPGGLKRAEIEGALGFKVDVVVPDLPRRLGPAATMGELAVVNGCSPFRTGILDLARHLGVSSASSPRRSVLGRFLRRHK